KPRSSALPWVLGVLGVLLAILGAFAVGLVFALQKISEAASRAIPTATVAPATAAPATAAPPAPTTAAPQAPTPVSTSPIPPGTKVPRVVLATALDPTPMWTMAEVLDVAKQHEVGMSNCVRDAFSVDQK